MLIRKSLTANKMKQIELRDPTTYHGTITKTNLTMKLKTQKSAETVEDIDPPLLCNIGCVGHSFAPGSQSFLPMVTFPYDTISFLPCGPNESSYNTIEIINNGDTPVYYNFSSDSKEIFRVHPSNDIIPGRSKYLVCIEFNPKSAREYQTIIMCTFNHSATNVKKILARGICDEPSLTTSSDGKLYFPPSYPGVSTKEKVRVRNNSLITMDIRCSVPQSKRNEVSFEPETVRLRPKEIVDTICTFTPLSMEPILLDIPIYCTNVYDWTNDLIGYYNPGSGKIYKQKDKKSQIYSNTIHIIGAGATGSLDISPKDLDYGTVKIGDKKIKDLYVSNNSVSNLYIEVKITSDEKTPEILELIKKSFKLNFDKGILNSRSKLSVTIEFCPVARYDFKIYFVVTTVDKQLGQTKGASQKPIPTISSQIAIHANGDFPLVKIIDVRYIIK